MFHRHRISKFSLKMPFAGLFGILLLLPLRALCETGPLESAMVAELKPYVRTVTREFTVFNFAKRQSIKGAKNGALSVSDPAVRAHLVGVSSLFLKPQKPRPQDHDSSDALGLYAAIDPFISQNYGEVMVMIPIAPGHRYLEESLDFKWSAKTRTALAKAGCHNKQGDGTDFRHTLFSVDEPACRSLAVKVLSALELDSVAYHFGSFAPAGCNEDLDFAFVFLGERGLRLDAIEIFEAGVEAASEHATNQQAISGMMRAHPRVNMNFADLWPDLKINPKLDLQAWASAHLLACQKP